MFEIVSLCTIAFLAGLIQGMTGFGIMMVALPLMVLFIDIKTAIPLIVLLGIVINALLIIQLARYFEKKKWLSLFLSSLPGIPIGIYMLKTVETRHLEILLGVVILFTATFTLISKDPQKELKKIWAYVAGFIAGLLGGSIGAPGPPVIIYTSLQPWAKQQIKATMVAFFALGGTGIIAFYFFTGFITKEVLISFQYCILPLVLGVFTGIFLFNRINENGYRRLIHFLLFFLGTLMLVKG
jgi:uncharacterized membrane protein YfcA